MEQIYPNLHLVRPASRAELGTRFTYLITRADGNYLLENLDDVSLSPCFPAIERRGGVRMQFINDRHNASSQTGLVHEHFGAPLCCSDIEAKVLTVDKTLIRPLRYERQWIAEDFEAIPVPGHTRGAFAYLWHTPQRRYLFIGDTLVSVDGIWKVWVPKPSIGLMIESLEMLKTVEFDVMLGNSFASTVFPCFELNAGARIQMLEDIIGRLRSGNAH